MIPLHDDNPTRITPFITIALMVLCILTFMWQASLDSHDYRRVLYSLGMIPIVLFHHAELPPELVVVPAELTLLTSMFMHGGFMHLAGNMLYLWIFGNNVEDSMGHWRFTVFYLLCGIAAALGQALVNPHSQIPMVGASGAISGVLGAYMLVYPRARVLVLVPLGFVMQLMRLPAAWVLVFWFVFQIISSALSSSDQGGVAWMAHIAGFVAGMALIPFFKYRTVSLFHKAHGSRQLTRRIPRDWYRD